MLIVPWTNHIKKLRKEATEYPPPGNLVRVSGKQIHIYTQGDGETTLVFLAGHGTSSPTIDLKPLWMRMVEDYRIAVVKRSGYGWSETSNSPRDIETILEETREALHLSGEKGPYVLFPHSMSGLEAIFWAQKYPDEVKDLVGLDPCTPASVDILPKTRKMMLNAMYFISRIGLSRYMPESEDEKKLPLMKVDGLTEKDKQQYLAVFYKSTFTKDMVREVNYLKENAEIVAQNEIPFNTPIYFFISEEQDATVIGWKEELIGYLSKIAVGKYMQLAASHYIHYEQSEIIAAEAKAFLEGLN